MIDKTMEKPKPRLKNLDELFNLANETAEQEILSQRSPATVLSTTAKPAGSLTILTIPFDLMDSYKEHPFNLYDSERRDDMVESIKSNGILQPLILRPKDDGRFEILSGHNRKNCAMEAGHDTGPAIIKESLTDAEALMYVIETNLIQRSFSDMSHSEKAAVLALQHSKLFSQGKRNDILEELKSLENPHENDENLTSLQNAKKSCSAQKVGDAYGLSKDAVARYLRIAKLTPALAQRLDADEIPFIPAVALSFLKENEQDMIDKIIELNEFKVDMKKACTIKDFSAKGKLNDEKAYLILNGEIGQPPKKNRTPTVKVKRAVYSKYFSHGQSAKEIQKIVEKALDQYFATLNKSREQASAPRKEGLHIPDDEADYAGDMVQ